jgi:acetyl-CoA acyltransferase
MARVAIVDAVRTPIARAFEGALRDARPDDLAARCVDALLDRNPRVDVARVDDCVVGCAFPEGAQGMNLARNVAVLSRLGARVSGVTVSRYCGSGLDAVAYAAARISSGDADAIVAAGVESISMTMKSVNTTAIMNPAIASRSPGTYLAMRWENERVPFWKRAFRSMGEAAEVIARRAEVSREAQDEYATLSQSRAARAQSSGVLGAEIAPALGADGKLFTQDECPRPDTTPAVLAELEPAFRADGTVTAGTSCPAADGACALLLASEDVARREGWDVLGWFVGYATAGCEPDAMAHGPVLAIPKVLRAHRLDLSDVDLFEINEAFAAQVIHCERALGIDRDRLNVNGGAIAFGHPFGMSGARLVGHAARELRRRGGGLAVASTCIGGGMGTAALIQA